MAYYAALASLVNLLEDIIHHDRYPNFLLAKQPIMKHFHEKFTLLEELMKDYSSKDDEASDLFERKIRDVAYRAQDIIESKLWDHIDSEEKTRGAVGNGSCPLITADRIAEDVDEALEELKKEIDSIVEEVVMIKEMCDNEDLKIDYGVAEAKAPVGVSTMVGFDEYQLTIKDQLCGQSSQLQVISVVGTGGIGKTTLARNTFDDRLVLDRFDCRAWGTVSQDYHVSTVLQSIVKSLGWMNDKSLGCEESVLKEHIYKHFKGRRYLVVLDDIWSTKAWDDFKQIFPDDYNGSRIILTTRLLDVAQYATTSDFLHHIQFLNEDQSWKLLQERVFADEPCPPELEDIGKDVARKCFGLPLAIVVISGILSNAKTQLDWVKIAVNVSGHLQTTEEHFYRILSLSYNHLPHQLKVCFLYMGRFPEDHEIKISDLIRLWVADGFLKSVDKSKVMESVAEECLEDLVRRNLVLLTKKKSNGKFKFCVLHDLLRDFCRQKAFHELFFHVENKEGHLYPRRVEEVRRLNRYYSYTSGKGFRIPNYAIKLIRDIHFFQKYPFYDMNPFDWNGLKLLRVLNAPAVEFEKDEIRQTYLLKYVCFHMCHPINTLTPSMSMLQSVQTVIIHNHCKLIFPPQFWKMTQLRHVIVHTILLPSIPMSSDIPVQKLEQLQTLVEVEDFIFTYDAIKMIPNVRRLKISYTSTRDNMKSCCLSTLVHLWQLEKLDIKFASRVAFGSRPLPASFSFPMNLVKLNLEGCQLPWRNMTAVGRLPNLQVLKLKIGSFYGKKWKSVEEQFLRLKFLSLEDLELKDWQAESSHFPCLECLEIMDCLHLSIPSEIGEIPTLTFIEVYDCGEDVEESAIQIREEQRDMGNDVLQVHVIQY